MINTNILKNYTECVKPEISNMKGIDYPIQSFLDNDFYSGDLEDAIKRIPDYKIFKNELDKIIRDFFSDYDLEDIRCFDSYGEQAESELARYFGTHNTTYTRMYPSTKLSEVELYKLRDNPYMCFITYSIIVNHDKESYDDETDEYYMYTDEHTVEGYFFIYLYIEDVLKYKLDIKNASDVIKDSCIF